MKLAEIIDASHLPADGRTDRHQLAYDKIEQHHDIIDKITSTLSLGKSDNIYSLLKDDKVLGFLELGKELTLNGETYDSIEFIYLEPQIRKTRAAGAFLIALKRNLKHPLVLGSDTHGGVLFAGGKELVKALDDSAQFHVSVLDLNTGEKTELTDDALKTKKNKTLVFENTSFPLTHFGFFIFENCEDQPLEI